MLVRPKPIARTSTKGVSLPEVLVAILIMAGALFPLIRIFSRSYLHSSKQAYQEQALKIAEGVLAKLMAVQFELLEAPSGAVDLPFEVVHGNGSIGGQITLAGVPPIGSGTVSIGKVGFHILAEITREFHGPPGGPNALMFHHFAAGSPPPPPAPLFPPYIPPPPPGQVVATYSCPDSILRLAVTVSNPESLPVKLATFRADLRK